MLSVKNNLIEILETYCPDKVFLQGTLNPDEAYPDTFITFFINDSDLDSFYDDEANRVDWYGAVMIYSANPDTLSDLAVDVFKGLKAGGFIPQGVGSDIPSDVETHTGWAIDFIYLQNILDL